MSFLQKFKGKTTLLKRDEVGQILGEKNSINNNKPNSNHLHLLKLAQISDTTSNKHSSFDTNLVKISTKMNSQKNNRLNLRNNHQNPESQSKEKKMMQNPFLVQNQFFIDQQQHQQVLKKRKVEQMRIRMQKQRKKKQQLQQKMMKSINNIQLRISKQTKRQWIKLGGLGPNIGGQQWTTKKNLHDKMVKFAEQIKRINMNKLQNSQSANFRTNKSITERLNQREIDPRTLGIKYSKTIQKPAFYSLQKYRYQDSKSKELNSVTYSQILPVLTQKPSHISSVMIDPIDNQFDGLKFERNYSDIQKLQSRHKELKYLVYGNNS